MWEKTEDKSSKHRIRKFEMPPRTSLGRGMPFLTELVIKCFISLSLFFLSFKFTLKMRVGL